MTVEIPHWWGKCEYCHKVIESGIGTICTKCANAIHNPRRSAEEEREARRRMREIQQRRDLRFDA